ncbi:hypothetical protein [Halorubrum vacuolatum]|uniref:Domain of unknown function domain-containing protein n=1 Tax=Halorubrum vacuolatum TaxID=63740 RepID=A0A238VPQ3_HALVU|nr:hypothetical protein [Halorubrum vacuolatum]SNR36350.1 hypothetical protein SAMN06264855_103257 [Halorubrum vacuolatum]
MSEIGSLLTPTQREYLRGKSDITDDNERMTQNRIKDRITQGLVEDIQLLQQSIESDAVSIEYKDIVNDMPKGTRRQSISRAIVFICRLAAADDIDVDDLLKEVQIEVKEGRKRAIRERLRNDDESVTISELLEVVSAEEVIGDMSDEIDTGPTSIDRSNKREDTDNQ